MRCSPRLLFGVLVVLMSLHAAGVQAKLYQLIPYGPVGPSHHEIIGGTIRTDGTLGTELDPNSVITDWEIELSSDGTGSVLLSPANSDLTALGTFDFTDTGITTPDSPEVRLLSFSQDGIGGVLWGRLFFPAPPPIPSVEMKGTVQMSLAGTQVDLLLLNSGVIPVATIPEPATYIALSCGVGGLMTRGCRKREPIALASGHYPHFAFASTCPLPALCGRNASLDS